MNKNTVYKQLEEKMVQYKDIKDMVARENGDSFTVLNQEESSSLEVIGRYGLLADMKEKFPKIPVRSEVKKKLDEVNRMLKKINPDYQLVVTYGFRSMEIQQTYFEQQKHDHLKNKQVPEGEDINEIIHRLIAVPPVAGHPTGGAVDVLIENSKTKKMLDFGTEIYDFDSKDIYSLSPFISAEAKKNRLLLRENMMSQGFAPYDGEWWHFSFGDKEWAFYYKKPQAIYEQKSEAAVLKEVNTFTYSIIRPGGNDTALVIGIERDAKKRKEINDKIMAENPNVEQVGFVNLDIKDAELMMAGGEFCGNATRSTAWQILQGKTGEILIKVSGVKSKLRAGVDEKGNAWAEMPIYKNPKMIKLIDKDRAIVMMEGITHVVMNDEYPDTSSEDLKKITLKILQKLGLSESVPASGVMFLSRSNDGIKMRPVVWVRDIKTLFDETACGSGTTAVGLVEALKQGKSVNLPVIQPTGMVINIKIDFDGKEFGRAVISGPIQVLK